MENTTKKAPSFEESYDEICSIVEKQRPSWKFKASVMRDFDDVKSEIVTHIWKKWHLYDSARPLPGWVATVVKHKMTNLLRDVYLSTSSPCARCVCNLGEGVCSIFGIQGVECPLYLKWYHTKRHSHNAKLPLALENHSDEVSTLPGVGGDIEGAIKVTHAKLKEKLTAKEWAIYYRLFVLGKTKEETAKDLGFKTKEKGRKVGYKRIRQVEILAHKLVSELLKEYGIGGLLNNE